MAVCCTVQFHCKSAFVAPGAIALQASVDTFERLGPGLIHLLKPAALLVQDELLEQGALILRKPRGSLVGLIHGLLGRSGSSLATGG